MRELHLFFNALTFYTRLPAPSWVDYSPANQRDSARYLPLIGLLVGGVGGGVVWGAAWIWPVSVAVLLSMVATIWLTGAFHEDGLADCCDGFGGGWSTEQVLSIMKDSHLGTYGVIGLGLILGLKFVTLSDISPTLLPAVILAAHSLSRLAAISFLLTHPYIRRDNSSKVQAVAQPMGWRAFSVASAWAIIPLLILGGWAFWLIIPLMLTRWLLGRYFAHRIGGYTGDCLGLTQQVTEVVVYLSVSASQHSGNL